MPDNQPVTPNTNSEPESQSTPPEIKPTAEINPMGAQKPPLSNAAWDLNDAPAPSQEKPLASSWPEAPKTPTPAANIEPPTQTPASPVHNFGTETKFIPEPTPNPSNQGLPSTSAPSIPTPTDPVADFKIAGPSNEPVTTPTINEVKPVSTSSPYPEGLPTPTIPDFKDPTLTPPVAAPTPSPLDMNTPYQAPTTDTSQVFVPQETKSSSLPIILIVGIVSLLAVGGIAYFVLGNNAGSTKQVTPEIVTPPKITPQEDKTPSQGSAFGQILNGTPSANPSTPSR